MMTRRKWLLALAIVAVLALVIVAVLTLVIVAVLASGDGLPEFLAKGPTSTPVPVKTLRPTFTPTPPATSTIPPTLTPVPTNTPFPTTTPAPPTDTAEPPTAVPATATVEPPTSTAAAPTATQAPPTATKRPPQPTKVPPTKVPPTPVPQAKHVVGAHGVSGLVIARDKTQFAVGEKAFFTYEALNHTKDPVGFATLGIKASNGTFNASWVNPDVILPDVPFRHDDGLVFNSPGAYKVFLSICWAEPCSEGGNWEEFRQGAATITVK